MSVPVVAFFNNKGGVGKTSLVYHLAWMLAGMGVKVVAADLDPQANLTSAFLEEDALESLWPAENDESQERSSVFAFVQDSLPSPPVGTATGGPKTVFAALEPLIRGVGDVQRPMLTRVAHNISLLPGDLRLSGFEDDLSSQWPDCLDGKERAFRVISAFWRLLMTSAEEADAELVLLDVGPNLGAINRAALVASDYVLFPLAPDLFSVQGLQNLGPRLRTWRGEWAERRVRNPARDLPLPQGAMAPLGYVLTGHGERAGRPVKAYRRWMGRIPAVYRAYVLATQEQAPTVDNDPYCLAQLKHYRSLMPMAQEARKPVFLLKPADGAFGGHQAAVAAARQDFTVLARAVLAGVGIAVAGTAASS
jgi:cellulose biosynthesis protein BcsQ